MKNAAVTPNPTCLRCFASITVAYQTHGIDPQLLEEFLIEAVDNHEEKFIDQALNMSASQKMLARAKAINVQILLNLLRAKALS